MQSIIFGLSVTAIGVAIVFFGLVVLIGLIKIMQVLTSGMGKKKAAPKAAPVPAAAPAPVVEAAPAAPVQDDAALIAVISAAIAAMMEDSNTGFVVRRVRRVSNTPAWSKSGREEQVYSRF